MSSCPLRLLLGVRDSVIASRTNPNQGLTRDCETVDGRARDSASGGARMIRPTTTGALVLAAALTLSQHSLAQSKADIALRAAMETETVKGDLAAALKQYQTIVDTFTKTDRGVAASAL